MFSENKSLYSKIHASGLLNIKRKTLRKKSCNMQIFVFFCFQKITVLMLITPKQNSGQWHITRSKHGVLKMHVDAI